MKWGFRQRQLGGIGAKVFLLSFFSVCCALLLIGTIAYMNIYSTIKDSQQKVLLGSSLQVEENLKQYMKNLQTQLLFLSNRDIFQALPDNGYSSLLNSALRLHSEELTAMYVIRENRLATVVPYGYKYALPEERLLQIARETAKHDFWWSEPFDIGLGKTVTVAKAFSDPESGDSSIVALDLNMLTLVKSIAAPGASPSSGIFLYSPESGFISTNMLVAAKKDIEQKNNIAAELDRLVTSTSEVMTTVSAGEDVWQVLRRENNRWGWIVFAVINETEAYPLLAQLRQLLVVLLGVWLLVSLLVSYRLSAYIQSPIRTINRQMQQGAMGHLETRITLNRNDEFDTIARSFNQMMHSIGESFMQLKAAEEAKRYHEWKALQSQIRPHFLYNTLNAFYCLCEMNRSQEVGEMIRALLSMLRYSIDKVGDIVRVAEEIEHVDIYVKLMKLRYGDLFDVEMAVPKFALEAPIPKLTLITLVENSIFYGMQKNGERNRIRIGTDSALEGGGDGIRLVLSDTGPGMPPDVAEQLFRRESKARARPDGLNNLGIRNVHDRIKLYFGGEYGLHIENRPGDGVTVHVLIPQYRAESHSPLQPETKGG